ncbi:MAG: hypothetical protein COA69_11360 [Robiginitomaculum sp.]|nr:MAG: hypothetical protein COA69_11360 [Robiginitomaculum sp.]
MTYIKRMKTHVLMGALMLSTSMAMIAPTASATEVPRPASIDVTRDNYQRVVNVLQDAGLNRAEIKRWVAASKAAHAGPEFGTIPNPNRVEITRRNYKRIVNTLQDAGLNRRQIKRWINASVDAHSSQRDLATERRADQTRHTRGVVGIDVRPAQAAQRVRPVRAVRTIRPTRTVRPVRAVRPVRSSRPVRTRG